MTVYPIYSLKYEFEITEVGGDTVAVCLDDASDAFHGIVKLQNDSAAFMFGKLKEGITLPALIIECIHRFSEPVEEAGPVVLDFLNKLEEKKLIKTEPGSEITVK